MVAAGADGSEARLDGTLRPDDHAAKKYVVPVPRARGERVGSGRGNFYQKLVSPIQIRRGSFAELRRFAAKNFQAVENDRETLRGECRKSFFLRRPFSDMRIKSKLNSQW